MSSLADSIHSACVEPGCMRAWFVGGPTVVMKSGESIVVVDPYYSEGPEDGWRRRTPSLIGPGELSADIVLVTHSHTDHCDPGSLEPFVDRHDCLVAASPAAHAKLQSLGGKWDRVTLVARGECASSDNLTVHVLAGGDPDEEDAVAYLVVSQACAVVHPGDLRRPEAFRAFARLDLGTVFIPLGGPVGGRVYYPDAEAFERLAELAQAAVAVPIHWDLWQEAYLDAREALGPSVTGCHVLSPGEAMDVPARSDVT